MGKGDKMTTNVKIGASLMCANLLSLKDQINVLDNEGIDYFHIDIMDGKFVPNFGLNIDIVKYIKQISSTSIHSHLMIWNPDSYIRSFVDAGCDAITIHQESTQRLEDTIQVVKDCGVKVFIALNPSTSISTIEGFLNEIDGVVIMTVQPGFAGQPLVPSTIEKISELKKKLINAGLSIDIQTDGNVNIQNIPRMVQAGATMLVGGSSSLFSKGAEIPIALKTMRAAALIQK